MRLVYCFLGFVLFGLLLFLLLGDALVDQGWLAALGPWLGVVAVGLLLADIVAPIPTTVILTVLGQQYGPLLGGAIGSLGSIAAGLLAYGLARLLGQRFARWLLGEDWTRAQRFYARHGAFAVVCSRWLPLLPEAISCLAGLTRMPFGRYCLALVCGSTPMCFAYAALASVSDQEFIPLLLSIILPVPIWWITGRLLHQRLTAEPRDGV
jgi:uncharacterized membrane protein YdjX (TVP38/TMEM64 family)